jgi:hypothetical protein
MSYAWNYLPIFFVHLFLCIYTQVLPLAEWKRLHNGKFYAMYSSPKYTLYALCYVLHTKICFICFMLCTPHQNILYMLYAMYSTPKYALYAYALYSTPKYALYALRSVLLTKICFICFMLCTPHQNMLYMLYAMYSTPKYAFYSLCSVLHTKTYSRQQI